VARLEKTRAGEDPFFLVTEPYLKIKTKTAELIPLKLNRTQQIVIEKIKELQAKGKLVRIWILKARQTGISTLIEAIIYAFTSQRNNINSLIIADEKDHASNLFEMSKLYHDQLDVHLAPALKKSNEKKLEFEKIHSQIIIASAENTEAARSHTFQLVHISEAAYFRDLGSVLRGLMQSVPETKESMIFGETTANSMEAFYDEWIRAIEGKTDWIPLFIPWFLLDEYSMQLQSNQFYSTDGIIFGSQSTIGQFLDEEQGLRVKYGLTNEQLNWRRWAIVNKCQGHCDTFAEEFPATWQEAFQRTGLNFFDMVQLQKQITQKPIDTGEIFLSDTRHEFRSMPGGRIEVFERPQPGDKYFIILDASEAIGQDEASIYVGNVRLNRTAAVVAGQIPPEDLAHLGVMLGNWYNNALVVPENKGYGHMVCQLIFKQYGNIYRRVTNKSGDPKESEELGFNTNSVSRPEMLGRLAEEVRLNSTQLLSDKIVSQCRTFVIDPDKKKAEALPGKQDGLVICRAIFAQVRHERPYVSAITHNRKQIQLVHDVKRQRNGGFGFSG